MKRIIFTILLALFCNFSFLAQSKVTNEEYKVYAVALREIYKEDLENNKQIFSIVILDETFKPEIFDNFDNLKIKGLTKNFVERNKSIVNLESHFPIKHKYNLVSKSELDNLFEIGNDSAEKIKERGKENGIITSDLSNVIYKSFYEKFPKANGYYRFTRIGFSVTKKYAAFQVYGEGAYWSSYTAYILVKIKGRWRIYESSGSRGVA